MKALITGSSGNLGYEVSKDLARRGISLIACVRPGKRAQAASHPADFAEIIECDIAAGEDIDIGTSVDCIVHCAGVIHFRDVGAQNANMMQSVLSWASRKNIPIYYASTAFVYRPSGDRARFYNAYEEDKYNAEQLLSTSGVPYSIFRPSVLTGATDTGAIQNFSGHYLVVRAFLRAAEAAKRKKRQLRYPKMRGKSNMVPVDVAAQLIGETIAGNRRGTFFITDPNPPSAAFVLEEALKFFNIHDSVARVDCSFEDFGRMELTEEETELHRFSSHFHPYWSMNYVFPLGLLEKSYVDRAYLMGLLKFFLASQNSSHEAKRY